MPHAQSPRFFADSGSIKIARSDNASYPRPRSISRSSSSNNYGSDKSPTLCFVVAPVSLALRMHRYTTRVDRHYLRKKDGAIHLPPPLFSQLAGRCQERLFTEPHATKSLLFRSSRIGHGEIAEVIETPPGRSHFLAVSWRKMLLHRLEDLAIRCKDTQNSIQRRAGVPWGRRRQKEVTLVTTSRGVNQRAMTQGIYTAWSPDFSAG